MPKKSVRGKGCSSCGKPVVHGSKFCKHCGANAMHPKKARRHHCPSCRGAIEEFSRFCKHCGANIETFLHTKYVKVLMYLIMFLVVALALLLFFSPTIVDYEGIPGEKEVVLDVGEPFLRMNNAVCTWQDDSFNLCANVNWKGSKEDYVKCSFGGTMSDTELVSSPLTCCEDVGVSEGTKLARAFLIDGNGNSYLDDGLSAECKGAAPSIPPAVLSTTYEKSFWFTARMEKLPSFGSGVEYIKFPGKVKSCEISGNWETSNNDPFFTEGILGTCHKATGLFFGSADFYGQSVFSDPAPYKWAGTTKPLIDPIGTMHTGYGVHMYLCDNNYLTKPRYYVRGIFSGFDTDELLLEWEYNSNYPKPKVDVFVDLSCEIV
tara:strand:- start:1429 stop:2556 length:1128 start_codon:yes stop_codon:yes gene_type:complete